MSEAAQGALIGESMSITSSLVVILTLIVLDLVLSIVKRRQGLLERWIEGLPLVLVENGHLREDIVKKARVSESDILSAARQSQSLERMDQIKFAVLEKRWGNLHHPQTLGHRSLPRAAPRRAPGQCCRASPTAASGDRFRMT